MHIQNFPRFDENAVLLPSNDLRDLDTSICRLGKGGWGEEDRDNRGAKKGDNNHSRPLGLSGETIHTQSIGGCLGIFFFEGSS